MAKRTPQEIEALGYRIFGHVAAAGLLSAPSVVAAFAGEAPRSTIIGVLDKLCATGSLHAHSQAAAHIERKSYSTAKVIRRG